jgi:hypothetical protein
LPAKPLSMRLSSASDSVHIGMKPCILDKSDI